MTATAVAKNSVYQQLRSHLAYLRLGAAAEALPAELDRARSEDLSHSVRTSRRPHPR